MRIFAKQHHWGYLVIAATVAVTLALWLGSMWYYDAWYDDRFKYVAKLGSMPATLLMCWAFILATRFGPMNRLFGGLDKVYKAHRHVGEAALFVVFLHPLFLALHRLPDWGHFLAFFWFSGNWLRNTGIVALLLLLVLVALSIWVPMRYHRWRMTHSFLGLVLAIVLVHGILAQAEIMRFPLLRAWFALWILAAFASYLYIRVLYRFVGPLHHYTVDEVREHGDIAEIYLRPDSGHARMRYRPGQFLYVSFDSAEVSAEPHPFSISSAPEEERLRLSVKELGDWTSALTKLKPGEGAHVWGPYGQFGEPLLRFPDRDAVLIAGGIGITPFLSMLKDRDFMAQRRARTFLIYSVVTPEEAQYEDLVRGIDLESERIAYIPHVSDDEGFLDAEGLRERVGDLPQKCFLICGPKPMMDSLKEELDKAGVPAGQVFTEDFSLV